MQRAHTLAFLSELRKKVEAGSISKKDAERLAVIALQEVAEAPAEEPEQAPEAEEQAEEEAAPAPEEADPIDPKSRILAALTKLEQDLSPAFKAFQDEINALLMETKGAAVPLGEFTIGAEELNAKVAIAQKDQASVICTYNLKQDWTVGDLELPAPVVASVSEDACHLGLRRELLTIAEEVLDHAGSALAWNRYELPREKIVSLAKAAKDVSDLRVLEVTSSLSPTKAQKTWENWALGAVTQILGSDYVKTMSRS